MSAKDAKDFRDHRGRRGGRPGGEDVTGQWRLQEKEGSKASGGQRRDRCPCAKREEAVQGTPAEGTARGGPPGGRNCGC